MRLIGVRSFFGELIDEGRLLGIPWGGVKCVGCCNIIGEDNGVLFEFVGLVNVSVEEAISEAEESLRRCAFIRDLIGDDTSVN